ncbi:MAG: phosphatase PAP2 family protein [Fidelibacterota bacterium]
MNLSGRAVFPRPLETIIILYLSVLNALLIIYRENLYEWKIFFIIHTAAIIAVYFIGTADLKGRKKLIFLRDWYVILSFIFLYNELGNFMQLVSNYYDPLIIKTEGAIFAFQPSLKFSEYFNNPLIADIMHFFYFSYYGLIPGIAFILYMHKKYDIFRAFIFTTSLTFFAHYITFIVFPVACPRFALINAIEGPIRGIFFSAFVQRLIDTADIMGGGFPSSHVAVAFVVLLFTMKYERPSYWIFLIFVIGLVFSTVYGRFHYALDAVAGAIFGFLFFYVGPPVFTRLYKIHERTKLSPRGN